MPQPVRHPVVCLGITTTQACPVFPELVGSIIGECPHPWEIMDTSVACLNWIPTLDSGSVAAFGLHPYTEHLYAESPTILILTSYLELIPPSTRINFT